MEVAKDSGERYPPRTVYRIVCGLKCHLGEKFGDKVLNPLDAHVVNNFSKYSCE